MNKKEVHFSNAGIVIFAIASFFFLAASPAGAAIVSPGDVGNVAEGGAGTTSGSPSLDITVDNSSPDASLEDPSTPLANFAPGTRAWKFRSDLSNSGVYDDGTTRPDGTLLWAFSTGSALISTPAVVNGIAYFGSNNGHVYAVDAAMGTALWDTETRGGVSSSPAVVESVVYFGSDDGNVYALEAGTGDILWNFSTNGRVLSSPAITNGSVYFGSFDGNVRSLDAATGELFWTFSTGSQVRSSPAVANGTVYIGSDDGKVYAIEATTGAGLWNYSTGGIVCSSPAVAGGVVYIGSRDDSVYALDAGSGVPIWKYTAGGNVSSSPAVANGTVYIADDNGAVYALDAATGIGIWEFAAQAGIRASPAVAGDVVYIGSRDRNLYALDAATGEEIWEFSTGQEISSSPVVANGTVYIGSTDGNLYAIGALSAMTRGLSIFSLDPPYVVEGSPGFTLIVNGTGFSGSCSVLLNGEEQPAQFLDPGRLSLDISPDMVLFPRTMNITVRDGATGAVSNRVFFHVRDRPGGAKAWKFRSDLSNSGVYDCGGVLPGGELLWKSLTEGYYGSSPAVVDGIVYACGIYDVNAIDAFTGKLLWTSPYGGGRSSPAVTNGTVYTVSTNRNVSALDQDAGSLLWSYAAEDSVTSSPAVASGAVYIADQGGRVYALDAGTGALLWSYAAEESITSSPAVASGAVYIADQGGRMYALDAGTGALLWNYAGEESITSSPAVASGAVYIADRGGRVSALDGETGSLLWDSLLPTRVRESSPAIADGVLYIGSVDGRLYALDADAGGAILWSYATEGGITSSPAVSDGVVFVGSSDSNLYAIDASTGDLLWNFTTGDQVIANPAVADGIVYIQSTDGYLYALTTLPDEPPGSVTGLHASSVNGVQVTWAWNDPHSIGFSHVMVYLDGVFQENITRGVETWSAGGLAPSTTHTVSLKTVGLKGAVNDTVVSNTATTTGLSIVQIDPAVVIEDSPAFTLDLYGTGFAPGCAVLWNGDVQAAQFLQAGHIRMEVPAELVAHSGRVNITVLDGSTGELSNAAIFRITDNPATAKARKFRSDMNNTGVYDDGGRRPVPVLLWQYTTGAKVTSSPAVVDGVVYIGSQDRNLYALDAATGTLLWKYDTMERNDIVSSSPAVSNGVVYIGGLKTKIHALDALKGDLLWNYKLPIRTTVRSGLSSSAAVANGIVYIGNMDGSLYAFDEESGDLLWKYTSPASEYDDTAIFSSPAVSGDAVFIHASNGDLYSLDALTGTLRWSYTPGGDYSVYSSPAVSGGVVYSGSGPKNTFFALDAATGAPLWNFTTGGSIMSSPAIAGDIVYFGSNDGRLYALDAATGAPLWNFTAGDRVSSSPAIANGIVYFGSNDGRLYALDAATGAPLWNYTTQAGVSSSPAVVNGIVYFGSSDGSVYAVGSLPFDPPVAGFAANVTSGAAPLVVVFTDTSTGVVTTRFWDFGDGTTAWENSTATINHTYLYPGTFSVSLTAANPDGQDKEEKTGYITVRPSGLRPRAWFSAAPMTGYRPLSVQFTDRSMGGPIGWQWDLGDGNTSTERNPHHTYTEAGTYRVTLTVLSSGGSSSYSSPVWVRDRPHIPTITPTATITPFPTFSPRPTLPPRPGLPPTAFFKMNTSIGRAPLTVQFTDLSFNAPMAWDWDFGDGRASTVQNPVMTFAEPGTYRVSLRVENAYGQSSTSRFVYVR